MSISIGTYGPHKPGPGVAPLKVGPPPDVTKHPFGKPAPLNWWTGKHLALGAGSISTGQVQGLGSAAEGNEQPLLDEWVAGGEKGVSLWVVSRVVYRHTGDQVLYKFLRKLTFNKEGALVSISNETRIDVDATVPES